MSFFNRNPITDAAWELTKKQYPEWNAPRTALEGLSEEEKKQNVSYSDYSEYSEK